MSKVNFKKGIGIIEVLVGSAILALVLFAFISSLSIYSAASSDATKRAQALFLAEEAIELTRALRDENWTKITALETSTPYGFEQDEVTGKWSLTERDETIDGFTRKVFVDDVYRNSDDEITDELPSTYDGGTRSIKVKVTWESRRGEQSIVLESLLTNALEN